MSKRSWNVVVAAAVLGLAAVAARADSAKIEGMTYRDAMLRGFKDGKVLLRTSAGQDTEKPFSAVDQLEMDNQPRFNEAEKAMAAKDFKKAATAYGDAIARINVKELRVLAQARAVKAFDADGRFVDAVRNFLDVYAASPTNNTFVALRPQNIPAEGSQMLTAAAAAISSRLTDAAFKAPESQLVFKSFLLDVYNKAKDPKAAALAKELGQQSPVSTGQSTASTGGTPPAATPDNASADAPERSPAEVEAAIRNADTAMAARKYQDVIKLADGVLSSASGDTAIRLFMLKAEAYKGLNNPEEAALAYLRVPAHYPNKADRAAEATFQAAEVLAPTRPEAAKKLYRDVAEKYPNSPRAGVAKQKAG